MSKRRKQEKQRNQRNKKLVIFIAIIAILIFGLGIFWSSYSRYQAKRSIESFVGTDLVALTLIDINKDSEQSEKLKQVGLKLGDEKYFSNFLKNLILKDVDPKDLKIEEELFLGWIGNQMAIGNIRVTPKKSSQIIAIEIKNHDLLEDFVFAFEDRLEEKGFVIEREEFRDLEIVKIKKSGEISFTIMEDYLLVSEFDDGLKKMVDTKLGRDKSIAFDKDYKRAKRKLKKNDGAVFVYGDLVELVTAITKSSFKLDKTWTDRMESFDEKYYVAAKLTAEEDKVKARLHLPKMGNEGDAKKVKSIFGDVVSPDAAFFTEGASLKSLFVNIIAGESEDPEASFELFSKGAKVEYGIDLKDIADLVNQQYAFYVSPDFVNEKAEIALTLSSSAVNFAAT